MSYFKEKKMNLEQYNDKEYLKTISQDEVLLNQVILDTKGFILNKFKENNILPNVDFLLKDINTFKFKFLTDNYTLNDKQMSLINNYINKNSHSNSALLNLTKEELDDYIMKGVELPSNTILNIEQINKYHKEINEQLYQETTMEEIMKKSFNKFSESDVLKINKQFLKDNIFLINKKNFLKKGGSLRNFYKQVINERVKNSQEQENSLRYFYNYDFDLDEKDFFISLIRKKNKYSITRKNYSEISKISGVDKLLDKFEFMKISGNLSLDDFTLKEIEDNLEFFQEMWVNHIKDDYYEILNSLFRIQSAPKEFETIVNRNFFIKLFSEENKFTRLLGHLEYEYDPNLKEKVFYSVSEILDLYVENVNLLNNRPIQEKISVNEILNMYKEMSSSRHNLNNINEKILEKNKKNLQVIYNGVSNYFKNNKIDSLINDNDIVNLDNIEYIISSYNNAKEKGETSPYSSINSFFLLLSLNNKEFNSGYSDSNYIKKESLQNLIINIQTDLLKDKNNVYFVDVILNHFISNLDEESKNRRLNRKGDFFKELKGKISFKNKIKLSLNLKTNFITDTNMFAYENFNLEKLDGNMLNTIYSVRPDILNKIIEDKVFVNKYFIKNILHNSNKVENLNFLKKYVNIHIDKINEDSDFVSYFLSNVHQKEIYPYMSKEVENKTFSKLLEILYAENKISNLAQQLYKEYKGLEEDNNKNVRYFIDEDDAIKSVKELMSLDYKQFTLSEINDLYNNCRKSRDALNHFKRSLSRQLSFEFMQENIQEYINQNDFKMLLFLDKNHLFKPHSELFCNYVNNLNFDNLSKLLTNNDFLECIKKEINYDNETKIKFSGFTKEENNFIAEKLMNLFSEKSDKYNSHKFFHMFALDNREFIKDFVINNMPLKIFYTYDFLPNDEDDIYPTKFISSNYTNEEIIRAFKNLKNDKGVFSDLDINSSFYHFFNQVFFERAHKGDPEELENFKNFMKMAEQEPELYFMLSNKNIFSTGLTWGKDYKNNVYHKYKNSEEAINAFFVENFNLNIVLKGLDLIIKEMKEKKSLERLDDNEEKLMNYKLASHCITAFIHDTYYEKTDEYGAKEGYGSYLSDQDTLKIMKFLYEKAPTHFIERHVIGVASDPVEFFVKNIDEFNSIKSIENFIFPSDAIVSEYFRLDDSYGQGVNQQYKRLEGYVHAIITDAIDKKEIEKIKYLNHIINQHEFLNNELDYSKVYSSYENIVITLIEKLSEMDGIKDTLNKALLKIELDSKLDEKSPNPIRRVKRAKV